jgi:ribosome modulation factor
MNGKDSAAWKYGYEAGLNGKFATDNPYKGVSTESASNWLDGLIAGKEQSVNNKTRIEIQSRQINFRKK